MNPLKCKTHVKAADFLGNTIALVNGEIRLYAQRSRVAAFMKMPAPKRDKRQLLSALASVAWWRTSVPAFGKLVANLYALSGDSKNVTKDWNASHDRDWKLLKEAVAHATCRYPANSNFQKVLVTDACQGSSEHPGGLAGYVAQIDPETGFLQPLGFFARPLANTREQTMSPRHLERRAILATLHKFSDILSGQRLAIMCRTDHKGLTSLVNNEKSGILKRTWCWRHCRWRKAVGWGPRGGRRPQSGRVWTVVHASVCTSSARPHHSRLHPASHPREQNSLLCVPVSMKQQKIKLYLFSALICVLTSYHRSCILWTVPVSGYYTMYIILVFFLRTGTMNPVIN